MYSTHMHYLSFTKILLYTGWLLFLCGTRLMASDFGEYQIILDKQLLGVEERIPTEMPKPIPPVVSPSWSKDFRMTMMTRDQNGIRVGIQNLRDNTSYLLVQGRMVDQQLELVSADYSSGIAKIRYQGSESQFSLESGPTITRVEPQRPAATPVAQVRNSRRITRNVRDTSDSSEQVSEVRQFRSREELQRHLEEQQMDAIRNDKPLLPIAVTQEMDDQLVREGVLLPE